MKACWLESTKDIKSGLPGYGVAFINGIGGGIEGAAGLVETGCHLAATGARGIKTGASMAYGGAQAVGQGCNYAYEHPKKAYAHTLINLSKARKAGAEFLWEVKESFVPSDDATADRVGKRFVDTVMAIEAFLGPDEETDQKIQNFRNLSGPDCVYFITKNVVEAGIISRAGVAGKALKMEAVAMKRGAYGVRVICPAITALGKQTGVRLIGKEIAAGVIDVSAQPIPHYCLENASICVANKAAEIILAHEGTQLLAVLDKVAITKSPQFLTQLPGTLALKAAAQATLSTNTFGAIGAGTSVVTPNSKAALIAGVVEKALSTEAVELNTQVLLSSCLEKQFAGEISSAIDKVVAKEAGQLLVVGEGVSKESAQLLMQAPRTLALKATAEAALSTNTFGAISAGTSVVTSNSKSGLLAGVVEKTLATEVVETVLVAETTEEMIRLRKATSQANKEMRLDAQKANGKAIKKAAKAARVVPEPLLAQRSYKFDYILPDRNHVLGLFMRYKDGLRIRQYTDSAGSANIKVRLKSLKHIFGIEIKQVCNSTGELGIDIYGFHHDYKNKMRHFLHNLEVNGSVVKAMVRCLGKKKPSTFFPSSWPPEKVLKAVQQALLNLTKEPVFEDDGSILFSGVTKHGMEIKIVVNKMRELVTAYPVWKK